MSEQQGDVRTEPEGGMAASDLREALGALDWSQGLTRQQIKRKCRALPGPSTRHWH